MSNQIVRAAVDFLRRHPPFDALSDAELLAAATASWLEFFPRGCPIPAREGGLGDALCIIQKGSVALGVAFAGGDEGARDMRAEGEVFELTAPDIGGGADPAIRAAEDTLCYLIPRDTVDRLREANPRFGAFFGPGSAERYLERGPRGRGAAAQPVGNERLLFTTPVRALLQRAPVICPPSLSIRDTAARMRDAGAGLAVIADPSTIKPRPLGIVTDNDLRNRMVAAGRDPAEAVSAIMSAPVITLDSGATAFEAMLAMMNRSVPSLVVLEGADLAGVVTSQDLMLLPGSRPLALARELARQSTVEDLAAALQRARWLIPQMLHDGARPFDIGRVASEISDLVTARLLDLAEAGLGRPPLPYCWVVMGSEGRREQTFKTDQDNALIYADPSGAAQAEEARRYFEAFATRVGEALEVCGFPACPANYMARNPAWRQPVSEWERRFDGWLDTSDPAEIMHASVFLDMRAVGGDASLAARVAARARAGASRHPAFLAHLTRLAIQNRPPIGFFRNLTVERSGPRKEQFDIKKHGIMPISDAVRVMAAEVALPQTNTVERIRGLSALGRLTPAAARELEDTFEFLMLIRLERQADEHARHIRPTNFINPRTLSSLDRHALRESFQVIARLQAELSQTWKALAGA